MGLVWTREFETKGSKRCVGMTSNVNAADDSGGGREMYWQKN